MPKNLTLYHLISYYFNAKIFGGAKFELAPNAIFPSYASVCQTHLQSKERDINRTTLL